MSHGVVAAVLGGFWIGIAVWWFCLGPAVLGSRRYTRLERVLYLAMTPVVVAVAAVGVAELWFGWCATGCVAAGGG